MRRSTGEEVSAPGDELAAISVLSKRGLLNALAGEWPRNDSGWMDHSIVGKLTEIWADGHGKERQSEYLGFMLLTYAAPVLDITGKKLFHLSGDLDEFKWDRWNTIHAALRTDWLHLLPLSPENADLPMASLDLGMMTGAPKLVPHSKEGRAATSSWSAQARMPSAVEEWEFCLELPWEHLSERKRFLVRGHLQAARWERAIKAAMLTQLSFQDAIERDPSQLVLELQHFDMAGLGKMRAQVLQTTRQLLFDFLDARAVPALMDRIPRGRTFAEGVSTLIHADQDGDNLKTAELLELLLSFVKLPRLLLNVSVRKDPPRFDVIDFFTKFYHVPFCQCMSVLWQARSTKMTVTETVRFAVAIDEYRSFLTKNCVEDPSLSLALASCANLYSSRFRAGFLDLAHNVAQQVEIELLLAGGGFRSSAAHDLLYLLGSPLEMSFVGPPEMRTQAACILEEAFVQFRDTRDERLTAIESLKDETLLVVVLVTLLAESENAVRLLSAIAPERRASARPDAVAQSKFKARAVSHFQADAAKFCDQLVGILATKSGMLSFYERRPGEADLVSDLKSWLESVVVPAVRDFVGLIESSSRRTFVDRVLGHLAALEVAAVLKAGACGAQEAAKLQERSRAFREAGEACLRDDVLAPPALLACDCLDAVASFLSSSEILDLVQNNKWLSASALQPLLFLRSDIEQRQRSAALESLVSGEDQSNDVRSDIFAWALTADWVERMLAMSPGKGQSQPIWDDAWLRPCGDAWARSREKVFAAMEATEPLRSKSVAQEFRSSKRIDLDAFLEDLCNDDDDESANSERDEQPPNQFFVKSLQAADSKRLTLKTSPVSGADEESEEEDDELLIGYLYIPSKTRNPSDARSQPCGISWLEWWQGWTQRFFVVTRDMRSNRALCWFRNQFDPSPQGVLYLNRVGAIVSCDEGKGPTPYAVKIEILHAALGKPDYTLELRSSYAAERDIWFKGLNLLKERDDAQHKLVERVEIVHRLPASMELAEPVFEIDEL